MQVEKSHILERWKNLNIFVSFCPEKGHYNPNNSLWGILHKFKVQKGIANCKLHEISRLWLRNMTRLIKLSGKIVIDLYSLILMYRLKKKKKKKKKGLLFQTGV